MQAGAALRFERAELVLFSRLLGACLLDVTLQVDEDAVEAEMTIAP